MLAFSLSRHSTSSIRCVVGIFFFISALAVSLLAEQPAQDQRNVPGSSPDVPSDQLVVAKQPEFLPAPTESEQAILDKLSLTIDTPFEVHEGSLRGIVDLLKQRFNIQILVDVPAMEEENIEMDVPYFNLSVSDVRGETLLKLLLLQQKLDYLVEDNILKITTLTTLDSGIRVYMYPVANLVQTREELTDLLDVVEASLRFRQLEGVYSMNVATRTMIATHNELAHREVLKLLRPLHRIAAASNFAPLPLAADPARNAETLAKPTTRVIKNNWQGSQDF